MGAKYNPRTLSWEEMDMPSKKSMRKRMRKNSMPMMPPMPPEDEEDEDFGRSDREDSSRRARVATSATQPIPMSLPERPLDTISSPDEQAASSLDDLITQQVQAIKSLGDEGKVKDVGDEKKVTEDENAAPTQAEQVVPGATAVSKIPAPPGFAYSINPITNKVELVDLTPLDKTKPLAGWKWIVEAGAKDPTKGHWVFVPTTDVLDKPFEGIPPAIIGWLKKSLDAGGDLNVVPEGAAREWVRFIQTQATAPGRRPEDVPFGLGLPEFPRADIPAQPGTRALDVEMDSLNQLVTSVASTEEIITQIERVKQAAAGEPLEETPTKTQDALIAKFQQTLRDLGYSEDEIADAVERLLDQLDDDNDDGDDKDNGTKDESIPPSQVLVTL